MLLSGIKFENYYSYKLLTDAKEQLNIPFDLYI